MSQYQERYKARLKPKNLRYVQQTLFLLSSLIKSLTSKKASIDSKLKGEEMHTELIMINDLQFSAKIDNINLFKIQKYFQKSEIIKKVQGFAEKSAEIELAKLAQQQTGGKATSNPAESESFLEKHKPALGVFESFMMSLTNTDTDGRILVQIHSNLFGTNFA